MTNLLQNISIDFVIAKSDVLTCKKPKSDKTYQVYRLSIKEHPADEFVVLESQIGRKKRAIKIEISRFNDVKIRSKNQGERSDWENQK